MSGLLTECVGICAVDLVSPHELLVWNITDSHHYAETISLLMAYQVIQRKYYIIC
jgi:hypothetical protein